MLKSQPWACHQCQEKGFYVRVLLVFVISIIGSLIVMLKVMLNKKAPKTLKKELELF